MPLTHDERTKQVAEWESEIDEARKDVARYEAACEAEKAAQVRKRIDALRKLRDELLASAST